MKKLWFTLLFVIGICSLVFAWGQDREANVESFGFPFNSTVKTHSANTGAETDKTVWSPASGNKIVLMGAYFTADTNTTLLIEDGSTAIVPTSAYLASGQLVISSSVPIWQGDANDNLTYTTGDASRHSLMVWGYEVK